MKHLYKYPQSAFPYGDLVQTNRNRSKYQTEYELLDTGLFNDNRYFDVVTEYAKNTDEDILKRITVYNRAILQPDIVGEVVLKGEIVDSKCYFGVMKPGEGKPHRDCAIWCISGGISPVLVVKNEQ